MKFKIIQFYYIFNGSNLRLIKFITGYGICDKNYNIVIKLKYDLIDIKYSISPKYVLAVKFYKTHHNCDLYDLSSPKKLKLTLKFNDLHEFNKLDFETIDTIFKNNVKLNKLSKIC
jgi:hypothetical protein